MATSPPSTTKLSNILSVYPNLTGCYTESTYTYLFWRQKEATAHTKRTGNVTSYLTKSQMIVIID